MSREKPSGASKAMRPHDHADCIGRVLDEATAQAAGDGLNFTPVRQRTLEVLLESHTALGAYDVLRRLSAEGFGDQPPVAYRALEFLVRHGFAHKIERLNAFVACMHPDEGHDPAFMICRSCRAVAETPTGKAGAALDAGAAAIGFKIEHRVVEAEGLCPKCVDAPAS